ncbi:MAG: DNA cytosine methyltransferase [Elusimicrobia bacterium]|nr:DNA cytosine methyltransferase [Elusimicrobiota bacterium]
MLTAIDLFSGGGGLTVGLKNAGFKVVAAVEMNKEAAATYKANHPDTTLIEQDIRKVRGATIAKASPSGKIDLIAGCPPCQGFSSLTAKYKRNDPRNGLVSEMERLIGELQPSAVMMENVPGLAMKGKRRLTKFKARLTELGYTVNCEVLQVADFGVPQRRRRLVLLAGKGFSITMPKTTHSRVGEDGLKRWENVQSVLKGLPRPVTLDESWKAGSGPKKFNWNVVRTLSDDNVRRLRKARVGRGWTSIEKRLRPTCHKNRKAGFSNVYGRMRWVEPSPTITGGCTTFSKGRFGHPNQLRTISVREAALLQTFPADYIIDTNHMEAACNIIGNALPCSFASAVATKCSIALKAKTQRA